MPESWSDDLCGRCLAILDTRTSVRSWGSDDEPPRDYPGAPTSPRALRRWVEEQHWGEGRTISVDDRPNAFAPVTTWHGDPVCGYHLQREYERDQRRP